MNFLRKQKYVHLSILSRPLEVTILSLQLWRHFDFYSYILTLFSRREYDLSCQGYKGAVQTCHGLQWSPALQEADQVSRWEPEAGASGSLFAQKKVRPKSVSKDDA